MAKRKKSPTDIALDDVVAERERQKTLTFDGISSKEFDESNTRDNWVGFITAYVGRASSAVRNAKEGHDFREMMVKAAATCIAAIEAHDQDFC